MPKPGSTEVKVPDLGDFTDVPVIEIHVAAGDVVSEEDPLITLESDKAAMDVPSPASGTVRELRVEVGDRVGEGVAHPASRHRRRAHPTATAGRSAGAAGR